MVKFYFSLLSTTLISGIAYADLNCAGRLPSCAEMGYSQDDIADCSSYLYCPFDTSYKVCTDCPDDDDGMCPDGKMTADECDANGGVLYSQAGIDENGCGTCRTCDETALIQGQGGSFSWTLIKKGEWPDNDVTGYYAIKINNGGTYQNSDFCIRGCTCYQGTPVTSANQITDGGDYCVAINGTLTVELPMNLSQKSGTYHFYKSSCSNANLRIPNTTSSSEGTLSGSLTSEVYTEVGSVDKNTWLHTITLTNGGKLIRNASDGTADITIKNGRSYTFKALGACSGAKRKVKCDGIERGLKLILESQDADLTAITSCFDFSGCQNADCSLNGKDGKINSDGECK